jgi:DNA-binding NarL/FixJ family response regulator
LRCDRVLLVDDHALVRDMLRDRLQSEPSLAVVGVASDAAEAIEVAREQRPDVIVMDIDMPGLTCFEAARRIHALQPETRLLFLSAYTHDHYIEEALRVGAYGYLTKGEPPAKVIAAIHAVADGKVSFSEEIRARIVVDADQVRLGGHARSCASLLTSREIETLRYIARGLPKKEIAGLMHVSQKTVAKHTEHLMRKLQIHDRVELARYAIREGLADA